MDEEDAPVADALAGHMAEAMKRFEPAMRASLANVRRALAQTCESCHGSGTDASGGECWQCDGSGSIPGRGGSGPRGNSVGNGDVVPWHLRGWENVELRRSQYSSWTVQP